MEHPKRVIVITVFIELLILTSLVIMVANRSKITLNVDLSQWQSKYISFVDNVWSVMEGDIQEEKVDLIYGPYVYITRGGYTVDVDYECEDNQQLQVYANSGNQVFIKANTITLRKNQTSISYDFELTQDIDNLEIIIKYNGKGACKIKDIRIKENNNIFKRYLVYLFFFFFLLDIGFIFYKQIRNNKTLILVIMGITFCISIPLFYRGMNIGHDGMFHRMRIDGIAEELRHGHFPVRMQSLWMEGYGYPVSIYYGDLLLYIPALLRLMGFNVTQCFKAYIILINLGTTVCSFWGYKRVFKRTDVSLTLAFVYVTAPYRLINVYIRSAVGEYTAMMFFPIIAAAVYGIYIEAIDNWNLYKKNAVLLTVGMSGLITSHILSTEMVCFVLIIVCLMFFRRTIRKNTIRIYALAIVQTILITFYFLVPFLDYYITMNVNINNTVENVKRIQDKGAYIVQYFSFWQNIYNQGGTGVRERFQMTPGIILMVTLFISIVLWYQGKADRKIKVLTFLSIVILLMASDLFPWDFIAQHSAIGNLIAQVQFPWRYLGIAVVFMTLLLGELLTIVLRHKIIISGNPIFYNMFVGTICIFTVCFFSSSYCNGVGVSDYNYDTVELDNKKVMNAEYLLLETNRNSVSNEIISTNINSLNLIKRVGNYMEIFCEVDEKEGLVEIPLFNYKGYQVTDEKGMEYTILNGNNNKIAFKLPPNFSGKIIIQFIEPWYWKMAMWVSIFCVLDFVYRLQKRMLIS